MSPSTAAKPAVKPRQPLSLRELFCFTTLAAGTLAVVLYREWTSDERWFLGLTLGGTLLGILAARLVGRRVWIAGTLGGIAGSSGALLILWQEWYIQYSDGVHPYREGVLDEDELRWSFFTAGAGMLLLGYLLALLTIACYRLLDRTTDSSESGLIRAARKRPLRVALVLSAASLAILAIAHVDFLLQPSAWSPRYYVPFQRPERPMATTGTDYPEAHARLSHDGRWLAVSLFDLRMDGEKYVVHLYQLQSQARRVPLPPINAGTSTRSLPEFSCDDNRCAYLVHANSSAGLIPSPGSEVHILDLKTNEHDVLEDAGHNLVWLPDGKLVVDNRLFSSSGNGWTADEIEELPEYHPRLGYAIYRAMELVRIVDLNSSRDIANWPSSLAWPAPGPDETYSPNGRFGFIGNEIYDHQLHTVRTWEYADHQTMSFHTFTRSGHAVGARNDWTGGLRFQLPWLWYVPLGNRLLPWLWREPVCLINPATGKEVARTQALWISPYEIAFSHDGSRMAVINLEGVYIYDVPAEFR